MDGNSQICRIKNTPFRTFLTEFSGNIEHRLTQPAHPWTNGQVERMNKTIKEATVKRYHYTSHEHLRKHLQTFIHAYNFAKRLKALQGLTPYELIVNSWKNSPKLFNINPSIHKVGLYIEINPNLHTQVMD
jgi:hypothetical protein